MSEQSPQPRTPSDTRLLRVLGCVIGFSLCVIGSVATWGWWSANATIVSHPVALLSGPLMLLLGSIALVPALVRGRRLRILFVGTRTLIGAGFVVLGAVGVWMRIDFLLGHYFRHEPESKMGPRVSDTPLVIAFGLAVMAVGGALLFLNFKPRQQVHP